MGSTECDSLVTDGTCTRTCTDGYTNMGGNGVMSCPAGSLTGSAIICAPDDCTSDIPTGDGYDTECDSLVTDGTCTQTCTDGYTNMGGNGVMSCPAGSLTGSAIICAPDDCTSDVPTGDGYDTQCDSLVTDGTCTQTCTAGYTNTGGGGEMSCPAGSLTGSQIICEDIDECASSPCGAHAQCSTPTVNSFTCSCDDGFSGGGVEFTADCIDINECMLGTSNNCHADASCENSEGSYTCECNAGYSGDGVSCEDVDGCALNDDGCGGDNHATCSGGSGVDTRTCTCDPGFFGTNTLTDTEVFTGCCEDSDNDGVCDNVDDCIGDYDDCGVCNGDGVADGDCDCDGNVLGCTGECGGSVVEDACGVCGGDGSSCADCAGVAYVAELGPYTNVAVMIYLPMRVIVMATLLMNVVCVAVMGHPVQRLLLMRCSRPADQKETVVEVPPLRLLPVRGRCWWVVEPVITFTLQRKP